MLHRWLAVISLLLVATSAHAWDCHECLGITEANIESYIGFREDSLKWKVKTHRSNPLVVTEFCFDDVKMIEKGVKSQVTFHENFAVMADGNFSMAYNKAHDWAFDLAVAVGYHFNLCNCTIRLTPFVGYEIDRQRLHSCDEDFVTDIKNKRQYQFLISQLTAYYRAHWNSPFIGFDVHYAINECWKLYSDFAYHFVSLRGKGHTTLGSFQKNSFESRDHFNQRSHGWGFTWDTGIQYALDCNWLLDLGTQFEYRKAHHGHQHAHHTFKEKFKVDGHVLKSDSSTESKNRIKHVQWRSLRIELGLTYRF